MKNFLDTLLQIKSFMPLCSQDQQALFSFEKQIIKRIRQDVKQTGTSDLFNLQSEDGNFLSHVSVMLNLNNLANEILKHNKLALAKNKKGETMAFCAINCNNFAVANKCLNNAELVKTKCNGTYFIFEATKLANSVPFLNNLIDNFPQYLTLKDEFNEHIGFYLVRNKKTKQAIKLIKERPEIAKLKNVDGDTMAHIAFDEQNLSVLQEWIDNKALRRIQNKYKQSVVHLIAIENRKPKLTLKACDDNIALKQQDYLGNTPAHYFCSNSNYRLANLAFKVKGIHTIQNNKGQTITDIAREKNDLLSIANYTENEK